MEKPVQVERERCVAICRSRAELWRRTASRATVAAAREEARARANEASYLADLIESGSDLSELPTVSDVDA
jgi:hypothetical protein